MALSVQNEIGWSSSLVSLGSVQPWPCKEAHGKPQHREQGAPHDLSLGE